jgi:hypothetical protein
MQNIAKVSGSQLQYPTIFLSFFQRGQFIYFSDSKTEFVLFKVNYYLFLLLEQFSPYIIITKRSWEL